jgi:hypothetical protein
LVELAESAIDIGCIWTVRYFQLLGGRVKTHSISSGRNS